MKKNKISFIHRLFYDILNLLFPITCACCGRKLQNEKEILCISCEVSLPKTNYHLFPNNPIEKKLMGRCHIQRASALYFSEKNTLVRTIIHNLKYKNNESLGRHVGIIFANQLKKTIFEKYDLIIPVPLHPSKQRMRGFNQCQSFAEGLSEILHIEVNNYSLIRKKANSSQTKLNRIDRWNNVTGIFDIINNAQIQGRKILLVDDVITTGSTIEACVEALQKCNPKEISVLCIAAAIS